VEKIGNYTIEAELSSGIAVRTFKVVPAADPAATARHLKLFPGSSSEASGTRREAHELQRELGEAFPQTWLPVHETGEADVGTYVVTPLMEDSLDRILGTVLPDSLLLQSILLKIVSALENLEAHASRAHGNLKPSNIFISGTGAIQQREILLADPAPKGRLKGSVPKNPDMRALGELIYMLATRTTSVSSNLRAVPAHARWPSLGAKEARWRDICTTLLDPGGRFQESGLAGLRRELEEMGGGRSRTGQLALIGVLAVLGLVGAFVANRFFLKDEVDHQSLREECFAYIVAYDTWLEGFTRDVARRKADLEDGLRTELEVLFRQRGDAINPSQAFGMFFSTADPASIPQSFLQKAENQKRIEESANFLGDLSQILEEWSLRREALAYAEAAASRGWEAVATDIRSAAGEFSFDEGLLDQLLVIQSIQPVTAELEESWKLLQEVQRDFVSLEDPFLANLVAWQGEQLASSEGLPEQLEAVKETLREVGEIHELTQSGSFREDYDYGLFLASLQGEAFLAERPPPVRAWRRHLDGFRRIPDPREEEFPALREMEERIEQDLALIAELPLGELHGQLTERLASLRGDRERTASIPGIERESTRINDAMRDLQIGFTDLRSELGSVIREHLIDPAEWLAKWREEPISVRGVMADAWVLRRDEILRPLSLQSLERNPARLTQLDLELNELRDFLTKLDQSLPAPQLLGGDRSVEVDRQLEPLLRQARERAERELASMIPPSPDLPGTTLDRFLQTDAVRAVLRSYTTVIDSASDFSRRFLEASREVTAAAPPSGEWLDFIDAEVLSTDGWIARSGAGVDEIPSLRPMLRLSQLRRSEDPAELRQVLHSGSLLSHRWVSWDRVMELSLGPADPSAWQQWQDAFLSFRGDLPEDLRSRLDGRSFWLRSAGASPNLDALVAALSAREAFEGQLQQLPVPLQFGHFILGLREEIAADPDFRSADADRLRAMQQRILDNAEARFPDTPPAMVRSFLDGIRNFDPEGEGEAVDPSEWGPGGLPQWTIAEEDDEHVVYEWEGFSLPFQLVDLGDGSFAYVCQVETPVGLVIEWFSRNPGLWSQAIAAYDWQMALIDRRGLTTWLLNAEMRPDYVLQWRSVPPIWERFRYPEGSAPPQPGDNHPMQYLPSWLALEIARSLNCQLPTPDTYRILFEETTAQAEANRRDLSWSRQQVHIRDTNARIRSSDPPWPDTGIFVPENLAVPRGQNAVQAVDYNDGKLWFTPVYEGNDPFLHLEGNVAEFAYDPASETFYVTGASAFSPPECEPSTAFPLSPLQQQSGFSDVGFRLAFPVPRLAPGAELATYIFNPDIFSDLFPSSSN
jgi:hypothetical protein